MNNNGLVIGITMVMVLIVGFFMGRFTATTDMMALQPSNPQAAVAGTAQSSGGTDTAAESGTTVNTASLPEGQRKLLENLGMDADSITITDEMVACAEAKLGAARVAEIEGGATPTFSEGAGLATCYAGG